MPVGRPPFVVRMVAVMRLIGFEMRRRMKAARMMTVNLRSFVMTAVVLGNGRFSFGPVPPAALAVRPGGAAEQQGRHRRANYPFKPVCIHI